jgi:hypothetical protein
MTRRGRLRSGDLLLAVAAMGGAIGCSTPPEPSDVEQVGRVEQPYTAPLLGLHDLPRWAHSRAQQWLVGQRYPLLFLDG